MSCIFSCSVSGEEHSGADVVWFEVGTGGQDVGLQIARSEHGKDMFRGQAPASDNRLSAEYRGV